MAEPKRACERCEWWGRERAHDDNMPIGTCRANSPVPLAELWAPGKPFDTALPFLRAHWRWTACDDWCSQFKERTAPPVKEE